MPWRQPVSSLPGDGSFPRSGHGRAEIRAVAGPQLTRIRQSTATQPRPAASTGFRSSSTISGTSASSRPTRTITPATARRSTGGRAAQPVQHRRPAQRPQQGGGRRLVHRGHGQRHVIPGLDEDAAQARQHDGAELRVPDPADHQLDAPALRLHEHARAVGQRQQVTGRPPDRGRGGQAQPDPARVGLVGEVRMGDLGHHGVAEPARGGRGGGGAGAQTVSTTGIPAPASRARGSKHAVRTEQATVAPAARAAAARARLDVAGPPANGGPPQPRPIAVAAAGSPAARARRIARAPARARHGRCDIAVHDTGARRWGRVAAPGRARPTARGGARSGHAKHGTPRLLQQVRLRPRAARCHPAGVDRHRHAVGAQPGRRVPHRFGYLGAGARGAPVPR